MFLTLKEFEPSLSHGGDIPQTFLAGSPVPDLKHMGEKATADSLARGMPRGYEVGYRAFSVNGRKLGHSQPITVTTGQRVLFHVLNASATEMRSLALPGHTFTVVALDGNPVPRQASVPVLWTGTAERVSAVVEMNHPGVWVLGDTSDDDRNAGMGTVVEYAGRSGTPQWIAPPSFTWDYRTFADIGSTNQRPDHTIDLLVEKRNAAEKGFNIWPLNGVPISPDTNKPVLDVERGKRYRLRLRNASDDIHPLHLYRHTFAVTNFASTATHGLHKDVVMLGGYQSLDLDFTADQPGLSLFHCHQQAAPHGLRVHDPFALLLTWPSAPDGVGGAGTSHIGCMRRRIGLIALHVSELGLVWWEPGFQSRHDAAAGRHELLCNPQGHYVVGMYTELDEQLGSSSWAGRLAGGRT
ncbi:multicopper oxidase domain-containing protein [Streptomyces sp. CA-142005]|uniref:multicopper oxidase domain-containing protein n=1 Tax=Streptomyces sp. CA-142005 TaxID=3240052 RepID=UPI003D8D94CF